MSEVTEIKEKPPKLSRRTFIKASLLAGLIGGSAACAPEPPHGALPPSEAPRPGPTEVARAIYENYEQMGKKQKEELQRIHPKLYEIFTVGRNPSPEQLLQVLKDAQQSPVSAEVFGGPSGIFIQIETAYHSVAPDENSIAPLINFRPLSLTLNENNTITLRAAFLYNEFAIPQPPKKLPFPPEALEMMQAHEMYHALQFAWLIKTIPQIHSNITFPELSKKIMEYTRQTKVIAEAAAYDWQFFHYNPQKYPSVFNPQGFDLPSGYHVDFSTSASFHEKIRGSLAKLPENLDSSPYWLAWVGFISTQIRMPTSEHTPFVLAPDFLQKTMAAAAAQKIPPQIAT